MSAPDTNLEKQERHHRGPLTGIRLGLIFVAVLLLLFVGYLFFNSNGPEGAEQQVEVGPTVGAAEGD